MPRRARRPVLARSGLRVCTALASVAGLSAMLVGSSHPPLALAAGAALFVGLAIGRAWALAVPLAAVIVSVALRRNGQYARDQSEVVALAAIAGGLVAHRGLSLLTGRRVHVARGMRTR